MDMKNSTPQPSMVQKLKNCADKVADAVQTCNEERKKFAEALKLAGTDAKKMIIELSEIASRNADTLKYLNESIQIAKECTNTVNAYLQFASQAKIQQELIGQWANLLKDSKCSAHGKHVQEGPLMAIAGLRHTKDPMPKLIIDAASFGARDAATTITPDRQEQQR